MFLPVTHSCATPPRWFFRWGVLLVLLHLTPPRATRAESLLQVKYEDYRESNNRIHIAARYALAQIDLNDATRLRVRGVIDTITGASPTGAPPSDGSDQVPLAALEDERHAAVASLEHGAAAWMVRGELSWSQEDDYRSLGYAATVVRAMNRRNTELEFGASWGDDSVEPAFFASARSKRAREFLVGVTHLLGRNTRLTATLAHGSTRGYLSDPYKVVLKTVELAPGLGLGLTFPENRPSRREKFAGYLELAHFIARLRAGVEGSLRCFRDDHGIHSVTLETAWRQRIGERWILEPHVRWYRQSAAEYYHPDLDVTGIMPVVAPDATTPHYSSDYRLSAFDAVTLGVKLVWQVNARWSGDAAWARYTMRGRDGVTSPSAYCDANILTLGASVRF